MTTVHRHTRCTACTWRTTALTFLLEKTKALPQGYVIIVLKVLFPSKYATKQKKITDSSLLLFCAQKKSITFKEIDALSLSLCHIKQGNNNKMQATQCYHTLCFFHLHIFYLLYLHNAAPSPDPCLQAVPRRFWHGRKEEG